MGRIRAGAESAVFAVESTVAYLPPVQERRAAHEVFQ